TLAAFAGLVRLAAPAARFLHRPRAAEVCALLAVALACAGYQMLFASLTKTTPGMWYAGIGLCTLDGYVPERQQRCARLLALLLSVAPLGLGLAWSLFDEDRLTWHDRLSSTYLRMR
ncbi:MAG: RDD family protein, partial [Terracidiphilus sp.]